MKCQKQKSVFVLMLFLGLIVSSCGWFKRDPCKTKNANIEAPVFKEGPCDFYYLDSLLKITHFDGIPFDSLSKPVLIEEGLHTVSGIAHVTDCANGSGNVTGSVFAVVETSSLIFVQESPKSAASGAEVDIPCYVEGESGHQSSIYLFMVDTEHEAFIIEAFNHYNDSIHNCGGFFSFESFQRVLSEFGLPDLNESNGKITIQLK